MSQELENITSMLESILDDYLGENRGNLDSFKVYMKEYYGFDKTEIYSIALKNLKKEDLNEEKKK